MNRTAGSSGWLRASYSLLLLSFAIAQPLPAAEQTSHTAPVDKKSHHLLNPVPEDSLRELSTDRPDKTESAITVDPGHYQLEADIIAYTRAALAGIEQRSLVFGFLNLRAGVLHNLELQVLLPAYQVVIEEEQDGEGVRRNNGVGDVTLRSKINLFGNDQGSVALALLPYVILPTSKENSRLTEATSPEEPGVPEIGVSETIWGLLVPIGISLPQDWQLGLMFGFETGDGSRLVTTAAFSRPLFGALSGYVEIFNVAPLEGLNPAVATFDFGLTYLINSDLQLDAGLNIGLTEAADSLNPFLGFSVRF